MKAFVTAVVYALLWLCALALAFWLIVFVLGAIGFHLPGIVMTILQVMLGLVAILVLLRIFWPFMDNVTLFPKNNPPN